MGAWGHGSFENDAALDWMGSLQEGGPTMIGEAFDVINDSPAKSYLDADECSAALAAAELLAAAHGKGDERLHPDAAAWLKDHVDDVRKADIASARRAVQRLYDSSELRELWDDNGADTAWHLGVRELLARLA